MKKKSLLKLANVSLLPYPREAIRSSSNRVNYKPNPVIHRNRHYEILVIKKGGGSHHIDFVDYPVLDNQVFFLRPGQHHCFTPNTNTEFYFIAIDHEKIELNSNLSLNQFDFFQSFQSVGYVLFDNVDQFIDLIHTIQGELSNDKKSFFNQDSVVSSYMAILLVQLQQNMFLATEVKKTPTKYSDLVSRFNQLVDDESIRFRSVKQYAVQLFVTPNYLNEKVKAETGYPASYWINHSLMVSIKKVLRNSSLSIKEVSSDFGFSTSAHFSRFFKSHQQCSPRVFRAEQ